MYDDIEFIIACGGKSTRNFPHSKSVAHKCLLPFGDVRLIDYVLKDIVKIGGRHVTIVCSDETTIESFKQALAPSPVVEEKLRKSGKGKIADVLKSTFLPEDMDIKYVIQDKPWGTSHVLGLAHRASPNRHAILIFPDDLIDSSDAPVPYIKRLLDAFMKNQKQILLTGVEKEDVSNNAILQDKRLIEKPKHPRSHIAGYSPYVFPKACLDSIERETTVIEKMGHLPESLALGEWVYTDGINSFLDNGGEAEGYYAKMFMLDPSEYEMLDTGNLELYEAAQIRELLLNSVFMEKNREIARRILEKGK